MATGHSKPKPHPVGPGTAGQSITWTALPNGTRDGGKTLALSVHVAPRLTFAGSPPPSRLPLSEYPDFVHWAAQDIRFSVRLGPAPAITVAPLPGRRPELWDAIFSPSTEVEPYRWEKVFIDPSARRLRSYPAARLRSFLAGMYSAVARSSPASWPSVAQLWRAGLSQVPTLGRTEGLAAEGGSLADALASLQHLYDRRSGAVPPGAETTPAQDIAQAFAFLEPFPRPGLAARHGAELAPGEAGPGLAAQLGPGGKARVPLPHPQVPAFELHQALSLLANHPPLARALGLVFDLEVPRPPGLPASFPVSVTGLWKARTATSSRSPRTMASGASFRPLERPVEPELADGYARLGTPGFSVIEVDLDGAVKKVLSLADGIRNALAHRAADTPQAYALPSLRSAGLSLARSGNAHHLGLALLSADQVNNQLEASPPPTLYAEDLTRGWRVDVWDDHTHKWHSLCARVAAPGTGGYLVGHPATAVPVPAGDEGWAQLATTSAPQGPSTAAPAGDLNVPETLLRWSGWSLVAPRPGAHLPEGSSGSLAEGEQAALAPGLPVSISYAATPGSLPVLRFGRRYRFQARAVDLAGNSVGLRPDAPPASLLATPAVPYLRFEPVASPFLAFRAPRTPGEHLELLVVRSNYDVADTDPSIAPCERHVAPPPVAEELAEAHGRLDGPDGRPDPAQYATLEARASATYDDPAVAQANGGHRDEATLGQYYFSTSQLAVPYLPDPLARGAAFAGLPGSPPSPKPLQVSFWPAGRQWPDARAFRLVLRPGHRPPELPSEANSWELSVYAEKGTVQAARISCYLSPADLGLMGLWAWLSQVPMAPKQRAELYQWAVWGRHWMVTPYREVLFVHAVRQPLVAPHFGHLAVDRQLGATYATLHDHDVTVDHRSTVRLDVLASWEEPFDDGKSPAGSVQVPGRSRVGELELAYHPTLRQAAISGMRHELGDTKHRVVYYEAVANTRFLEYFVEAKEVVVPASGPVAVSPQGFAPGATTVSRTTVATKFTKGGGLTIYREGVDYAQDDAQGTITRLPGGSLAAGEKVEVRFVRPPTTRTSLERPVAPAGPKGYRLSVPSSARPIPPDVRYLVPAFGWELGVSADGRPYSARRGGTLRVYLGRPWFVSGEGELLGVVLQTHLDVGIEGQLAQLFSRAGGDPLWASGAVGSGLSLGQLPLAVATASGVVLAEQRSTTRGMADVAGHQVTFDPVHGLWFADIEVAVGTGTGTSPSYWPFVRLGLARYQPSSLPGAEVSTVAQTDFAQLAPDRVATWSSPSPTVVEVTVTGPGVALTAATPSAVSMRAYVEVARPGVSDPDLRWQLANPDLASGTPLVASSVGANIVWQGKVALPAPRGSRPMRLRIQEAEHIPLDVGSLAAEVGQRVTYLDTIEL